MKIVICCSQAMSSSALVIKMRNYVKQNDLDIEVYARTIDQAVYADKDYDVLLLGPQIRNEKAKLQALLPDKKIAVVDMIAFGRFDAEAVIKQAKELFEEDIRSDDV